MKFRQIKYKCLNMVLFFLLSNLFAITANAYEKVDVDRNMSLKVIDHTGSESITGVEFQIYRVAKMTENTIFQMEATFKDAHVSLDTNVTEESWSDLAATLEAYLVQKSAENNPISPISSAMTDQEGIITFHNLHAGLYLLVGQQMTINQTIYTPLATLISLPYMDQDDESGNYAPTVNVKNSTQPISDTLTNLSVIKVWEDTGYEKKRPSEVRVTLYRNGVEYSTVELGVRNNWRHTWEGIESDGRWNLVEKDISSNYTVTSVQDGKNFIVTNTYCQSTSNPPITPTPSTLPKTGQLWWPISLLSLSGLTLFLIGLGIRRKGRSCHEKK